MTTHPRVFHPHRPFSLPAWPGLHPSPLPTAVLVGLLALGCAVQAAPTSISVPLDLTPAALFLPDVALLRAACDAGFQLAMTGGPPPVALDGHVTELHVPGDAAHPVKVQTATGSALNLCRNTAMNTRAYPDDDQLAADGIVWVQVAGGTVSNLRQDTERWAVTLSVMDSSGRELITLRPSVKQTGRPEDWTRSCPESNCVWQGHNTYGFQLTAAERTAVQAGSRVRVTVDLPESASLPWPVTWLRNRQTT